MNKLIINIFISILLFTCFGASGARSTAYAENSVLSEGKWARIKVTTTGMHLITDAQLRSLGFTDPSKVNVYGTGGRMVNEGLGNAQPDDLPRLLTVRTRGGIAFYATDWFEWQAANSTERKGRPYSHQINPYCETSYYYLSDRETTAPENHSSTSANIGTFEPETTFVEHLVHEQDLQHPGESGRHLFGEDFRTQKKQRFSFQLPDNEDETTKVAVSFAAKVSGGTSSIMVSANGTRLPSTTSDKIASTETKTYFNKILTVKNVDEAGDKLDIDIEYTYSGVLYTARLDFIEVFYTRRLRMRDGELRFHKVVKSPTAFSVEGCSSTTQIWEVTNPWAPARVDYTLSGTRGEFLVTGTGYREFVAFDPDKVSRQAVADGNVSNQNLHALESPDMLIISPQEYMEGARRIASLHESHDGMVVHVLTPEEIYNEFSGGKVDPGAFRKLLKMWHDRQEERTPGYCLIMGKPTYDPKRRSSEVKNLTYIPVPIWQSPTGASETDSYSTDDYIGLLSDNSFDGYNYDYISKGKPNVAVGRLPVKNAKESREVAAKIENYVLNPNYGNWRNKVMIIADDADQGVHLSQAETVHQKLRSGGNGRHFLYDRLYLDTFDLQYTGVGPAYPQATAKMLNNYNDGVVLTNYIGHGSANGWGHEHLWEWESITNMTNRNLPFMYAATCAFAFWDSPSVSAGEILVLNPDAGVIGMMVATRTVYIQGNGVLNSNTAEGFFKRDSEGKSLRVGDIYINGKGKSVDSNKMRYALIADPAMRIPSPELQVNITDFNDYDVRNIRDNYPEVSALGSLHLKGEVIRPGEGVATDFNGTVNLLINDAERAIEVSIRNEKGSSSQTMMYNDRPTRLAAVNAKVVNGQFDVSLTMPSEIENNYVPARITAYAWDGEGLEANGEFTKFYVYGYNDAENGDETGPEVEYMYLNTRNFRSGDVVNSSPVLFARVSDESGINLSEAGVGHKMTVTLDGRNVYDDVAMGFNPDAECEGAGTIMYPLSGITPGEHKLVLTVWDNANNVSYAETEFKVGAAIDPVIHSLTTNVNPASTDVTFILNLDRPNTRMNCTIGVYDLSGRKMWESSSVIQTDVESTMRCTWDLRDGTGMRVPRGIYLYRATVETPEGTYTSKTERLAVTAQ